MSTTPEARKALSATVRALRQRLLDDLHAATETVYRLSVDLREAGLSESARARRGRLESYIEEQLRAEIQRQLDRRRKPSWSAERLAEEREQLRVAALWEGVRARLRRGIERRAASVLLDRLIILRILEETGLRSPRVVGGGWNSRGYRDFRSLAPALCRDDPSEGYALLLQFVFEELATELPGLFGPTGIADLVPIPAATLRHAVEALDAPELSPCWSDDMTLGWVYQYWNDPEREALDARIHEGGKIEPHEIASKTQLFTERYMVDWLLQNSLGPLWLAICRKNGWTPEVVSGGTIAALEARRAEWRARCERGEVPPTASVPLTGEAERLWAYYVPQPVPEEAPEHVPDSVRDLKLLDPAVGSGHFLVVAVDHLAALYREEARHRGEAGLQRWSERAIAERIVTHNLHGIDLDARAVQIAAAALWLKLRRRVPDARPERMNLVASDLRLGGLPDDDPALIELRRDLEDEIGIPGALTETIVRALRGADHLGSLLQVDAAVDRALAEHEAVMGWGEPQQGSLFGGALRPRATGGRAETRATVLDRLETFLARHTGAEDLGLRLRGEQLAAGVRFVRLLREGAYDLVVGNPPYQSTSRLAETADLKRAFPLAASDLYAAFVERGLALLRPSGALAVITMRNWMFTKQFEGFRRAIVSEHTLAVLADLGVGAFEEIGGMVVATVMTVVRRGRTQAREALALRLGDAPSDRRADRRRAQVQFAHERLSFVPDELLGIEGAPLLYWWTAADRALYLGARKFGEFSPAREGLKTGNDARFLRRPWELPPRAIAAAGPDPARPWVPFVKGAEGKEWIEPLDYVLDWRQHQLALRISPSAQLSASEHYFAPGVAFTTTGTTFGARIHRFPSVFAAKGRSVFPPDPRAAAAGMNTSRARSIMADLNPTMDFTVGDCNRLPVLEVGGADAIYARLEEAFAVHESHREPSVEYRGPGPSPWRHARDWAQQAVDRPAGAPLPPYAPILDAELPSDPLLHALGVALGRFDAGGKGLLDDVAHNDALPHGVLFLDGTLGAGQPGDGLEHPAAAALHAAWDAHGPALGGDLRTWLRLSAFALHRRIYDHRPIVWPLSSADRTFVVFVLIHRWSAGTAAVLLADHLLPARTRLDGEIADLQAAREGQDKDGRAAALRLAAVQRWREELDRLVADLERCASEGPPPTDPSPRRCPPREHDARYEMLLDDGVAINSAALWPLLDPQWKEPKKWWAEIASGKGSRDADWSRLAMRYWPGRVDGKCQQDPSLAVGHGCLWRYHPEVAWAWELRLQDEIDPGLRVEEAPYTHPDGARSEGHEGLREVFLRERPAEALEGVEREAIRRRGRGSGAVPVAELRLREAGLWSGAPALCFALEGRMIERQSAPFRLLAPDEPEARAAWLAAHPEEAAARAAQLASLPDAEESA